MPVYQFEAVTSTGQKVKDQVEAASPEEALSVIRSRGFFPTKKPVEIKGRAARRPSAGAGPGGRPRGAASGRVSKKLLTQFTRQLSTLQDAGLPILRSLKILEQQQKPGVLRVVIRSVADDVEGGATLSEAMSKYPKTFDRLYVNMVAAGEAGGVLDVILNRLADFMEKSQRLKRRIIGAMIYPAVVITIAVIIMTGIMIFVVPKFKEIFSSVGTGLPKITQALISLAEWVKAYGWAVIFGTPVLIFLLIKLIRTSPGGRYVTDKMKISIPVIGQIVSKSAVARFTRTLGTLISAGVPILEAINITKETSGNEVFARALGSVHDSIREGETFAAPLRNSRVCDAIVVNMIDVGEETGDLDKMLIKIADNYDEEVDTLVGTLVSLLEPFMIVMLGGSVGFIVVALFVPLVTLINKFSGGTH